MEFTMSAMLSLGSRDTSQWDPKTTAPIHGFTYAEECEDGVNWHISEFFTDNGASWPCLFPDIACVEGVLFAACYLANDVEADLALEMIAAVINGDISYDETIGERAIAAASAIADKYHWTITRWPNCEFFYSPLLVNFPDDTIYFLSDDTIGFLTSLDE